MRTEGKETEINITAYGEWWKDISHIDCGDQPEAYAKYIDREKEGDSSAAHIYFIVC